MIWISFNSPSRLMLVVPVLTEYWGSADNSMTDFSEPWMTSSKQHIDSGKKIKSICTCDNPGDFGDFWLPLDNPCHFSHLRNYRSKAMFHSIEIAVSTAVPFNTFFLNLHADKNTYTVDISRNQKGCAENMTHNHIYFFKICLSKFYCTSLIIWLYWLGITWKMTLCNHHDCTFLDGL